MKPEFWERVAQLHRAALAHGESERAAFLEQACEGNEQLRMEVLSLLAYNEKTTGFLKQPALALAGRQLAREEVEGRSPKMTDRFLPGTVLARRYRVVALLGKGGMGEVYRADDLTLGQPVALKFLPEAAARDEQSLARLRNEVRTARRVTHPNVCRVYDLGEVDGETFLSMEYVDGEDLASLLRRIGRLPVDKALQIGQQLCAGLAEAHRQGVLHRDLKPRNVMLDGRGQALITDFGLAGLAEQIQAADVLSGTPFYMAPEQLEGREVSVKSDIYSLGLVLHEILTGKPAFEGATRAELLRARREKPPTRLSSVVGNLDPAAERVIARCLEADPADRPTSALAVAAALPGSDPLAAALAAGETPSPEMVAAAGETTGLPPRGAVACLAAVVVGMSLIAYTGAKLNGLQRLDFLLPPDVLTHRAREIVESLGYGGSRADSAYAFYYDNDYRDYVRQNDKPIPRWDAVLSQRPQVLGYWYRQSPRLMDAEGLQGLMNPAIVTFDDPPRDSPGMVSLRLDAQGRLTYLQVIPRQLEARPPPSSPADWKDLFVAAGLDVAQFHPADPAWNPLTLSDAHAAWVGAWPGSNRPLRVEAAAWRGKPVFFSLIGPWTRPGRDRQLRAGPRDFSSEVPSTDESALTSKRKLAVSMFVAAFVLVLAGGTLIARRNYVRGRADARAGARIAVAVFLTKMTISLCWGHVTTAWQTLYHFLVAISGALFLAGFVWVLYVALEPYLRHHWPHAIISWSRLVSGRLRDPLVGRDLLLGVLLGTAWTVILGIQYLLTLRAGHAPQMGDPNCLLGTREMIGSVLSSGLSVVNGLALFVALLLLRVALRNTWFAATVLVVVLTSVASLASPDHLLTAITMGIFWSTVVVTMVRLGLVATSVGSSVFLALQSQPYTLDFSAWYASHVFGVILSVLALAAWGFYTSLGGRPLWKDELFE
jgi:predicted Ser/Thr protein kinase